MRKTLTRIIAVLLCAMMLLQLSDGLVAFAAYDPTERIELTVPDGLQNGNSYFFIRESTFSVSEKSTEKLYIPIQRTGNLNEEAEVTLKLIDVTSRHDVNYTEAIYREKPETTIEFGDVSVLDLTLSADYQEEFEPIDEDVLAEAVYNTGGGDFVDADGNVVGTVTGFPLDENGDPIEAKEAPAEAGKAPEEAEKAPAEGEEASAGSEADAQDDGSFLESDLSAEAGEWTAQAESPTETLRRARDRYTGTVSDRQEMANTGDLMNGDAAAEETEAPEESELVEDAYPGKDYRLHFDAGEQAKFLVITPKYSDAAEGDCQLMLMLKNPSGMEQIPQDMQTSCVVITDEDEPEELQINMAEEVVYATDGKAKITVIRQGRINSIAGVHVYSWGGSAVVGEDYGGVGADLYFPMGITSRTIELPVGHAASAKEFYVSISDLSGAEIGNATTQVIIPAVGQEMVQAAELMDDKEPRLGSKINLKKARGYKIGTYFQWLEDGYGFESETEDDEEDVWAGWQWTLTPGYYYDGFLIKYDYYLNYCDGQIDFNTFSDEKGTRTSSFKDSNGGSHNGKSQYWYYAETKTPYAARANIKNYNNDGWFWTDDYARLYVRSVEPIIRRFKIKADKPVMTDGSAPHFEGVDPEITKNYVSVLLNDKAEDNCTIWGGENFSISQLEGLKYVKLVAIDAVKSDGTTYRLAENNGTSQTLVVTLDEETVNALGARDFFSWSKGHGGPNNDANSKQGNLTVRPVFGYINVDVQIKESQYGELYTSTSVAPSILWSFNADNAMNACMGRYSKHNVSWKGEKDDAGYEYYTFTATGADPYISIDLSAADASDVAWAKVRARNLSGADAIELFGHTNGKNLTGPECTHIDLEQDDQWHTYIINVPQENVRTANTYKDASLTETCWKGRVDWIRLDPMWKQSTESKDGDQIQIDYVAFFPTKEAAEIYNPVQEAVPAMLWDFNSDEIMSNRMGGNWLRDVTWKGENDKWDDYFTFTAEDADPYVSIDNSEAENVSEIQWVKIRARNLSGAKVIQLFARMNGSVSGESRTDIKLEQDTEWHEYYVNIPEANMQSTGRSTTFWNRRIEWIRLDPMGDDNGAGMKQGDQLQIDYVAFFPTEEAARSFRNGDNSNAACLAPGDYRFHLGDVMTFTTVLTQVGELAGLTPDGFRFNLFTEKNGALLRNSAEAYINEVGKLKLRGLNEEENKTGNYYRIEPTFTHSENQVVVQIEESDLPYFDTSSDLFATKDKWLDGTVWNYRVASKVRTNEIFELWATPLDKDHVPIWKTTQDTGTYSGNVFYFMTGVYADDNIVTLSVDRDAENHAYYSLSGTVYSQVMNLSTGRPSNVTIEAKDTLVTAGTAGAVTDEYGDFTLPTLNLVGNTTLRYTVTYNGSVNIREAKLAPVSVRKQDKPYNDPSTNQVITVKAIPISLNMVTVDSYSLSGAHFEKVGVEQDGFLEGVINAVEMNGQKVVFTIPVDPGEKYIYNNEAFTENITDVTVFFQHQTTKEVHGCYSIHDEYDPLRKGKLEWDPKTLTATLTFDMFKPDNPAEYSAGDVLMLQLTTDKKVGLNAWAGNDMVYDPVATGIAVITDLDYKPQTFEYEVPNVANLLQIFGPDENGSGSSGEASFGRFPFLGEIKAGLKIATVLVNRSMGGKATRQILKDLKAEADAAAAEDDWDYGADYDEDDIDEDAGGYEMADDGIDGGKGENVVPKSNWSFELAFTLGSTYYGGIRFMIAAIATRKWGNPYQNQVNPYKDANTAWEFFTNGRYATQAQGNLIHNPMFESKGEELRSMYGGVHFTLSLYAGLYFDFGYICIDGEKSGTLVFMGAGGFVGGSATLGYTWYTTVFGVPVYINPEASLDLRFYLGRTADPDRTLESFQNSPSLIGNDFGLEIEFNGKLSAGLTLGVGVYKVLGIRVSGILGFEAGYGNRMAEWYPEINESWGFTTDITFKGTIDLVITSIDLVDYSWPLPWNGGWMACLQEVRRAKALLTFVSNGVAKGRGTEEARNQCSTMADELKAMINSRETLVTSAVTKKIAELKQYAYEHKVITWTQRNRVDMNRQGGLIGGLIEEDDFDEGVIGILTDDEDTAETTGMRFHTRDHVQSEWVAGKDANLMGAFQSVHSETLEENAYAQTASQIMSIGRNKYLMVFLEDDPSRDRQQAGKIVYTVYNANDDTWTEPRTVQNDSTVDGKPSLVDAGDKLILTWASIEQSKYAALKEEVARELTELNGGTAPDDEEIQMELESDPVRVMMLMDVFTAEFDKKTERFSAIEQLTDDNYYDDAPQAVYDSKTGDYIVMYYKTAQDDDQYSDTGEQLIDLVGGGPAPDKTYAVLSYMLYNNQPEAKDTKGQTHEPGWARDYYFPNETDEDLASQDYWLEAWGGQRFLSAATADMSDPPITDLTVCEGYHDLAAYAFTVDRDYDLSTGEDKELYLQFYRFSDHSTYVPIKVGGEQTDGGVTTAVDVGSPKLVRNGGSTWLFWRENGDALKYLNVSDMLKDKVAASADPGENDWTWVVQADGTFAVDAVTGQTYAPNVQTVDFGSLMTDDSFNATDYQVISDGDDNLYVVWSDTTLFDAVDAETGESYQKTAQEIYASAMIREELSEGDTATDIETGETIDGTGSNLCANWSKPYRLTRENNFNDGIAIALDENGGLIIVHNQYEEVLAKTKDEVQTLLETGQVGVEQRDGKTYILGSLLYNSPIRLMVTRCAPVGSVEATSFSFSHSHPVAGETVKVCAAIENVGLTAANGCQIEFYEYRDGVRGRKIAIFDSDELVQVNTGRTVEFPWTIPARGVDGLCIGAVITEKKPDGTAYAPVESFSEPFVAEPAYTVTVDSVVQNGDVFDVKYSVTNTGNQNAEPGTKANLCLNGLYGDLEQRYGMTDDLLLSEDISGLGPRETRTVSKSVTLPVSVFAFCGYDAVQATVVDSNGMVIVESGQHLITMNAPMNLSLNSDQPLVIDTDESRSVEASFETNVFLPSDKVIYSVADPRIATVDEEGRVTGLTDGTTTLTATLLPSGRTKSVKLKVGKGCKKDASCPISEFTDAQPAAWYHDGVHWALEMGVMNGIGNTRFAPDSPTTRAMIVTMLHRMEGEPASEYAMTFRDVYAGKWYTDAIRWAAEKEIVTGYSAEKFGPEDRLTREQLVTILERYAQYKGCDVSKGEKTYLAGFTDASTISDWAVKAFRWAVNAGIINGVGENRLSPHTDATRAQVATMLMRYDAMPKDALARRGRENKMLRETK